MLNLQLMYVVFVLHSLILRDTCSTYFENCCNSQATKITIKKKQEKIHNIFISTLMSSSYIRP